MAFTLLTGTRDGAIIWLKLKHVDMAKNVLIQDAREVKTKFAKIFPTYFFPVGEDVRRIVAEWVEHLQSRLLWGPEDPLFSATKVAVGEARRFEVIGLERKHWSSATSIRSIFRKAFIEAGLPYFPPHSIRKTLVQIGEQRCRTPEDFKAWSQNLGHEQIMTTFTNYGVVWTASRERAKEREHESVDDWRDQQQ